MLFVKLWTSYLGILVIIVINFQLLQIKFVSVTKIRLSTKILLLLLWNLFRAVFPKVCTNDSSVHRKYFTVHRKFWRIVKTSFKWVLYKWSSNTKSDSWGGTEQRKPDLLKSRVFIKFPTVGNCYRTVVNKINSYLKVLKLKIVCILLVKSKFMTI